jgi:hypothetical protein
VVEVDREARDCLESPQIKGLPGGLIRVALPWRGLSLAL